ncbi:MAG TPA: 3-hydroxyacyl-CoA dehydrogenase family protein [Holophagaceae bacterium]|nr:3-hydroxyacyl-CoA dehydrogenase family protein [Holophagaceae bacterium]
MTEVLGILGPGVLGLSLAQWAAERGLQVRLMGRDRTHAERGLAELTRRWGVLAAKGKLAEGARETLEARVRALEPGRWEDCTVVLEATPEDPDLKTRIWKGLAERLLPSVLCLTGSSALPVAALAREAGLEGRLLGFHLFVPVRSMRVVELVVPTGSETASLERARRLGEALGLQVAEVRDGAGYAAARMSLALGLEAMRLLEEGVAGAADLDLLMKVGYGHPIGPIELSDRVGLDLRLAIVDRLRDACGERFQAPGILRERVARGDLGLKSGRGFLDWAGEVP